MFVFAWIEMKSNGRHAWLIRNNSSRTNFHRPVSPFDSATDNESLRCFGNFCEKQATDFALLSFLSFRSRCVSVFVEKINGLTFYNKIQIMNNISIWYNNKFYRFAIMYLIFLDVIAQIFQFAILKVIYVRNWNKWEPFDTNSIVI